MFLVVSAHWTSLAPFSSYKLRSEFHYPETAQNRQRNLTLSYRRATLAPLCWHFKKTFRPLLPLPDIVFHMPLVRSHCHNLHCVCKGPLKSHFWIVVCFPGFLAVSLKGHTIVSGSSVIKVFFFSSFSASSSSSFSATVVACYLLYFQPLFWSFL